MTRFIPSSAAYYYYYYYTNVGICNYNVLLFIYWLQCLSSFISIIIIIIIIPCHVQLIRFICVQESRPWRDPIISGNLFYFSRNSIIFNFTTTDNWKPSLSCRPLMLSLSLFLTLTLSTVYYYQLTLLTLLLSCCPLTFLLSLLLLSRLPLTLSLSLPDTMLLVDSLSPWK